jgi:hypothetical protein
MLPSWIPYLPLFLMGLPFVYLLVVSAETLTDDVNSSLGLIGAVALALGALVLLYTTRAGDYTLLNTTHPLLRETVQRVMKKHGIRYTMEKVERGWTTQARRFERHDLFLPDLDVRIAFILSSAQKSVAMKVQDRRRLAQAPQLMPDFKESLESLALPGTPSGGVMQLFGSIILLALSVYILTNL